MYLTFYIALIISFISCLINNPVVLVALIALGWLVYKAINTPQDPRNDL